MTVRAEERSRSRALRGLVLACVVTCVPGAAAAQADAAESYRGSAWHSRGATVPIEVVAGQTITVGTCGIAGARHTGDTTVTLTDPDGAQVAYNDDACGGLGSRVTYQASRSGTYRIALGCYASRQCGGRVVWQVGDGRVGEPVAQWSTGLEARALLGPDAQGLVADAWLSARFDQIAGMVLRLSGAPMGIAGGRDGGVLAGSLQLTVGWDFEYVEVGMGGGVSTLSRRGQGVTQAEIGVLALRARFGTEQDFHVAAQAAIGFPTEDDVDATLDVTAVLPIDSIELLARGVYGMSGVWLGEVGLVWWPGGSGRGGVGIAFLAGGAAVSYQPVCRFGLVCQASTYAGPHVGLGVHVRP